MKTLTYNIIDVDIDLICQNIESNINVRLGNINNDNPTYTNGYIVYGNNILTVYFYEDTDIQSLGSFFVVDSNLNDIVIAVDNYIKSNFLN